MRVSVFFYNGIDVDSILWRRLKELSKSYKHPFWIGSNKGFGATCLNWQEATTLAAKIAVSVHKSDCPSLFQEMRLLMQQED